ncbi:MAG: DNA-directed RNA polymerase subunit omega [Bacteroidales bacterium]|nr:DNA-directed RNA polymerase subunit omega [Bacteroidales bacterium]MBO7646804.1 DNA-directed RNA polymerase subunit omega [Bacteroidales bacterium]
MKAIDYKKKNIDCFAKTQDLRQFDKDTHNFYKSIVVMSKRADQIAADLKQEFQESSHQYATKSDSLEEVYENREQIELSRFYEQLPKPTQLALYEFENDQVYFRDVTEEE